jgi:hypothetical protein
MEPPTEKTPFEEPKATVQNDGERALILSSQAFYDGGEIPIKYTCQGQNISPPLAWGQSPSGTRSFVLIIEDLDAPIGAFTHWVLFNIPSDTIELPEAITAQAQLNSGALQGKNDFGEIGYGVPCPPSGRPHRYQFSLYALDQPLNMKAGAAKKQVLDAMQGHIVTKSSLTGTFQR